jgi:hypothetical protein
LNILFIMKSRGRPKKNIIWPDNTEFTTKDIKALSDVRLSNGLIHLKIKEALSSGEIQYVGKSASRSQGRPKNIYRRTK